MGVLSTRPHISSLNNGRTGFFFLRNAAVGAAGRGSRGHCGGACATARKQTCLSYLVVLSAA